MEGWWKEMVSLLLMMILRHVKRVEGLDNGVARLPPMGWSTWNTFGCNVDENLIRTSAAFLANSTLKTAGYEYILIDDCWQACDQRDPVSLKCLKQAPRDNLGKLYPDPDRFPSGMASLSSYIHSLSLKLGIYTAVSSSTCQGYPSSLYHELIDANTFIYDWNVDFIKHDTCNTDCGIHDECIQQSTQRMSDAIVNASLHTNRSIIYYIDSGNPTSPMKVYNPRQYHVTNQETLQKVAVTHQELAWEWAPSRAHMFKSWFDIGDTWESTMSIMHSMIRTEYYQTCGAYNMPDMLTVGMGGQTLGQYRVQFFVWALFSAPLLLGNDIRQLPPFASSSSSSSSSSYGPSDILSLLSSAEVLSVNQDSDCTQASRVSATESSEVWVKPLSDKRTLAAVFVNKHENVAQNISLYVMERSDGHGNYYYSDLQPINEDSDLSSFDVNVERVVTVRNLYTRQELGTFTDTITLEVPALDAVIISFRFQTSVAE